MDLNIPGLEDTVEIGRGGFATVYRAYQPAFRRTVAVKVLNDANLDDLAQERFQRECQAMGLLSEHPSIVTVLDAGFLDTGHAYMVMPFMPAGSLADRVRAEGPMPWADASRVAVKLAGALHAAHDAGVIHRDVKPANVLLSEYGEPKLSDFGIARVAGAGETQSGVVTASLAFAPPEIIEGRRPSVQSDIYSLAATIYDLVTGNAPFRVGSDASVATVLQRVLNEDPPDLVAQGVPKPLADVIMAAMAKDPAARPETAAAFGRQVRLAQDELGIRPTELTIDKVTDAAPAILGSNADDPTESGTGVYTEDPETVGVTAGVPAAVERDANETRDLPAATTTDAPATRRPILLVGIALAIAAVVAGVLLFIGGDNTEPASTANQPTSDESTAGVEEAETADTPAGDSSDGLGIGPTIPTLEERCPGGLDTETVPSPGVDLSGVRLECLDWSGHDLTDINFFEAELVGIDMRDANLSFSNFDATTLDTVLVGGASFRGANFGGTQFARVVLADFDFSGARTGDGFSFTHVEAPGYDFVAFGPNPFVYNFGFSDLTGANLEGMPIDGINSSIVIDANLRNSGPSEGTNGKDGSWSIFDGADLRGTHWLNGGAADASFVGADLRGADFSGANIHRADFTDALIEGASFTDADLSETICVDGSISNDNLGSCPGFE